MSGQDIDPLVAASDPAMVIVTTTAEGAQAGCLVGFHSQSSMAEPPHYCVWLSKANHTYRVALRASHLAVHFLGREDRSLAEHFGTRSGEDCDKFEGLQVEKGEHGVPLLGDCPHQLVLERLVVVDDGGDHVCFTGRVLQVRGEDELTPLRLSDVMHLRAGRAAEERSVHP